MNKILLLCGAKQSGKTSAANFVAAYTLNRAGIIKDFAQDLDGNIDIKINYVDENGVTRIEEEFAPLDLRRRDPDFIRYAQVNIWPYIKLYSFADNLKYVLSTIFNIDINLLYGNNEDKNQLTPVLWKDLEKLFPLKTPSRHQFLTIRELLQFFGTNVCRTIFNPCWVQACLQDVAFNNSHLSIIDDGRFPNEVYGTRLCKNFNVRTIRFKRRIDNDTHASETEIYRVSPEYFDLDLDNSKMTLQQKNQTIFKAMKNWGWIEGQIGESSS